MSFFGFGQTADIEIVFEDADKRKVAEVKTDEGRKEKLLLYYDGETVSGRVDVTLRKPGAKLEHQGIKVELVGQIELFYDRGNHHEFISLVKELARPGDLLQHMSYSFEFANVDKPYEVYTGSNVRLRYFLRATVVRRLTDVIKEVDIAVHTLCSYPDVLNSIKMEVGIEDCLHIEFEYNKSKYHLKDVIVGKIYFLLVRIKIKHMEISIIKRETTGSGPHTFTENETVAKYEIMDGAPVRGESIPIRVFLAGYDLTPTMRDINNKFSVRYYLNLVLMDTEDRRYFKQQEVTLWRKSDKSRLHAPHNPQHLTSGTIRRLQSASSEENSVHVASPLQVENPIVPSEVGEKDEANEIIKTVNRQLKKIHINNDELADKEVFDRYPENDNTITVEKPQIKEELPEAVLEKPQVVVKPKQTEKIAEKLLAEKPLLADKPQLSEKPPLNDIEKPQMAEKPQLAEKAQLAEKPLLAEKPQLAEKLLAEKPLVEKPLLAEKPMLAEKPLLAEKPQLAEKENAQVAEPVLEIPESAESIEEEQEFGEGEGPQL